MTIKSFISWSKLDDSLHVVLLVTEATLPLGWIVRDCMHLHVLLVDGGVATVRAAI